MTTYPVRVEGRLDTPLSRWLWLVKWLMLIPHFVVMFFLWVAFFVVAVVAFFAILFTGRYPKSLFEFNVGVLRWSWRVSYYGYGALGTDRYPPFTLAEVSDYPATLAVDYPDHLSRGLVLVKWWLLAIPHYIIIAFFVGGGSWLAWGADDWEWSWGGGGLVGVLVLVAGIILAVTGNYPRPLLEFILGMNRWVFRVAVYAGLMTDKYPPFRLDIGENEPGRTSTTETEPTTTGSQGVYEAQSHPSAETGAVTGSTAVAAPGAGSAPGRSRWTTGRIVSLVLGCLFALVSVGLLVAGGALLVADQTLRTDGFVTSDTEPLRSAGYAVVSDPIDLHVGSGPDWAVLESTLGGVRIRATSDTPSGGPVFLGIAPASDVTRYLHGVSHATVSDLGDDTSSTEHPGAAQPDPPAAQNFWATQASGPGTQSLTWSPSSGRWNLVAMNTDASRGVAMQADAGAEVPALTWVATALIVLGALLLALGVILIAAPVRRASRDRLR
ncbi:hypothetical protein BH24ACT15_BH24ACT15_38410 [soil metagenome]